MTARAPAVPGLARDNGPPLKLRACDADDLAVVSAQLQDAIVPVNEIAWLPAQRRFVMVVSRFRWEAPPATVEGHPVWQRVLAGVRFEGVDAVRCRGLDLRDRGRMLELLALEAAEGAVLLRFADGVDIRLEAGAIDGVLEDLGAPWPTPQQPQHPA